MNSKNLVIKTRWFLFLSLIIEIICTSGCSVKSQEEAYYLPGEFEEQEAVWLGWQGYEPYYKTGADMIEALLPFVRVKVVTESDSIKSVCRLYLTNRNIDTTAIQFYVIPDNEFWIRDHGAIFLKNRSGEKKVVDFGWNTYGVKSWLMNLYDNDQQKVDSLTNSMLASKRGKVDSLMAVAENIPVRKSSIFMEGGSIETNGRGTLILNQPLTLSRNEGKTKHEIEAEFKKALGVRNIIWLMHGLAEDPHIWQVISGKYVGIGTGGHTDEFVRFANSNTILLAWVEESEKDLNPLNRINYDRMSENFEILMRSRDENGKPFRIIKVPIPDPIVKPVLLTNFWDESLNIPVSVFSKKHELAGGDSVFRVAASSYLNYFVTNGAVLLPTYIKEGSSISKEEQVKQIFAEIFPDRKLFFIETMALNWEGGGIHCGTQQEPR